MNTQRRAQPVHNFNAKRGCLKQIQGSHENTASSPTSTQLQCQKRMLQKKQRLPWVHSVKPNQYTTSVPKEDVKKKPRLPWIHSVKPNQYTTSMPKEDVKKKQGFHEYTASSPTSTQLQCQKRMFKTNPRFPWEHSVKPNQYTTSVPKEDVTKKTKASMSTQRQTQPVHNFSAKRGC